MRGRGGIERVGGAFVRRVETSTNELDDEDGVAMCGVPNETRADSSVG